MLKLAKVVTFVLGSNLLLNGICMYDDLGRRDPAGKRPSQKGQLTAPSGYRPAVLGFVVHPKTQD